MDNYDVDKLLQALRDTPLDGFPHPQRLQEPLPAWITDREHVWSQHTFAALGLTGCSVCGIVQRRDGLNGPCPGQARIDLRRA